MTEPIRVLMSEGSSLSSRESLTALGVAGFQVEVVDPSPLCLARFSRHCARVHASPRFGVDPAGYLARVIDLLKTGRYDVLYPAHEQAFLFARYHGRLSELTRLALPPFEVFARLQSKTGFAAVLAEVGLPGPPTTIVHDETALREAASRGPVYVKAAFGTATQGTFRVSDPDELASAIQAMRQVIRQGVVVQEPVAGRLGRAQAVFEQGSLIGFHACVQLEEGVGGGDLVKESIAAPVVREQVARLGRHLRWHGGLSLDFITDEQGTPRYIDSNPRLAETGNALLAGLNLPELLVRVSVGDRPAPRESGPAGVRSFMGVQGLLRAARDSGSRLGVAHAIGDLACRRGVFANGREELTPTVEDWRSFLPLALVGAGLLASPAAWRRFSSKTIDAYAATPEVVAFLQPGDPGGRPDPI